MLKHTVSKTMIYAVENIQNLIVKILDENIIDLINGYLHISIHLRITNDKLIILLNKYFVTIYAVGKIH
jgi:hypothetical protein